MLAMVAYAGLSSDARAAGGRVRLRKRVEGKAVEFDEAVDARKTALILCDLWDKHWCRGATERVGQLVPKVAATVDALRKAGVLIIHAPSETMPFYEGHAERKAALALDRVAPPEPLSLTAPKLPIDDASGGCDTPGDKFYKAWTRQHPGIPILEGDLITDNGEQVYSALKLRGIQHLLVAGVHTNMCILNRSFAIKQMTKWGVRCVLVRDLTDAMYDPKDAPRVSHEQGTQLVIEHIEQYWCPTTTSAELMGALRG
jgi:nicotinamidase-related amidase